MRSILLLLSLSGVGLVGGEASAQPDLQPPSEAPVAQSQPDLALAMAHSDAEKLRKSGERNTRIGTVLSLVGIGGLAGGALLIREGDRKSRESEWGLDGIGEIMLGSLAVVAGGAVTITGAAFLVSGHNRKQAAESRARFAVTPNGSGGMTAVVSGSF